MRVADASFLVAALNESDALHEMAMEKLGEAEPIVIPHEVLVETLGVLRAKIGRNNDAAILASLRGLPHLELRATVDLAPAAALLARFPRLGLVDCIAIRHAIVEGAQLVTFDKTQRKTWETLR